MYPFLDWKASFNAITHHFVNMNDYMYIYNCKQ